ncbi:MAG: sensor histidine kinase [Pseudonocardiaceae bacterium]|nr:sensor histidine kinase [Pseudonocardiaceae bacterium]
MALLSTDSRHNEAVLEKGWSRVWPAPYPARPCVSDLYTPSGFADKAVSWGAYLLLGIGTVLSLAQENQSGADRLGTLGLVGIAAVWELLTFSVLPGRLRHHPVIVAVSFTGVLTIASILMIRDTVFLAFMIIGFFHALVLRPKTLMFLGLATCSVLIHTLPIGGPLVAMDRNALLYLTIIAVQTLSIGGGSVVGEKAFEQNEQRRKALNELEVALKENEGLHSQLVAQAREAGVLDERQRLAREIHDTLAQGFTGIVTQLEAAEQARRDPAQWRSHVDQARTLARQGLAEARRSVQALGPESLERNPLPEAISELADRWSQRTGVELAFETTGESKPLLSEIELSLYRVAQEALTNVSKHANASKVGVTLSYMDDVVLLDVRDDGVGIGSNGSEPRDESGYGLDTMKQRLRRVAGTLEVESTPGEGTAISASVPAIATETVP